MAFFLSYLLPVTFGTDV